MQQESHEEMVPVSGNIELFMINNPVDTPKAVIIIVHGICEHSGRYEHVASHFNNRSYSVYRFDNRGHGRSGGDKGYLDDFQLYIDDTGTIVEKAIKENPGKPVFMLGHSMGGFITACYGIQNPNKLKGQVLSGAPTILLPAVEPLKDFDYKAQARSPIHNNLTKDISRDPTVVDAYEKDPLNLKEFTFMLMGETFIRGMKWLIENTASYSCPCLILHGGDDKIVPADSSRSFHDKISSNDKKLKIYDGLYHEIMNEPEKEIVFEEIHKWLEKHI